MAARHRKDSDEAKENVMKKGRENERNGNKSINSRVLFIHFFKLELN